MSLLLEALRRAEEDSRKRKLAVAALATSPAAGSGAAPAATKFPDLTLELDEMPAAPPSPPVAPDPQSPSAPPFQQPASAGSNPESDLQAHARYARPDSPDAAQTASPAGVLDPAGLQAERESLAAAADSAPAPRSAVPQPPQAAIARPAAELFERAPPLPATTPRQALAAAGALAGGLRTPKAGSPRRRQWVLAAVALLLALPLAGLFLFGDAFFGGSGTTLAVNAPGAGAPPALNPSVSPPVTAPAALPDASASGSVTVAVPAPAGVAASPAVNPAASPVAATVAGTEAPASREISRDVTAAPRPAARPFAERPVNRQVSTSNSGPAVAAAAPAGLSLIAGAAKPSSRMEQAYAAYQAGRLDEATRLYREVLRADPTQRDAWLGLAVIAHASNQRQPALDAYKRVLRLEPQNATALAGVIALNTNADEPLQESRLRELLARAPQEADLNHALGLVLSGEQRWPEAQPLFFKAHALAPQEPRFAYNLAVTLDHLRKPALALQYYETALRLAQGKNAGFDESGARDRLAELKAAQRGSAP